MPRIDVRAALLEAEDVAGAICKSCSNATIEGSQYCRYCKMYWEDVDAGIFNIWDEEEEAWS